MSPPPPAAPLHVIRGSLARFTAQVKCFVTAHFVNTDDNDAEAEGAFAVARPWHYSLPTLRVALPSVRPSVRPLKRSDYAGQSHYAEVS